MNASNDMTSDPTSDNAQDLCRSGMEHLDARRFAEAEVAFAQARDLAPDDPEVYYCIGLLFADLARPGEAIAAFDQVIALAPRHAKAHNNRGSALQQLNWLNEAEAAYRESLALAADHALPYINLANVLDQQFRTAEALKVYDLALSRGVDPELIGQYRASLIGKATPRSPDAWVKSTFDNFAPTFDEHLKGLGYAVPAVIAAMLEGRTHAGERMLDLGCGTGWVGSTLQGHGLEMVGVDLSERMLVQARERNVYAELHVQEIHAYLAETPSATFDLVTSADVLIYIGRLEELFSQVHRVLRPGGLFALSIEESTAEEFALLNTGRYAHSRAYMIRLTAFRFSIVDDREGALRWERGKPSGGRVYLLRKI